MWEYREKKKHIINKAELILFEKKEQISSYTKKKDSFK